MSVLRLSKLIGVSWRTAHKILRKLCMAMGHQGSLYRLHGVIKLDDALIGGKRGRGAAGKTPVIVACEHNNGKPGFIALQAVASVNHDTTRRFGKVHLNTLAETPHHVAKVTPPEQASEWLP